VRSTPPAGVKDFPVADDFELPLDVDLLAVYSHAHYLGRVLDAFAAPRRHEEAAHPHSSMGPELAGGLRYRESVFLPRGTTASLRYSHDNSAHNASNPNSPPRRVVAGTRSVDEMAHLWLQVLPHGGEISAACCPGLRTCIRCDRTGSGR